MNSWETQLRKRCNVSSKLLYKRVMILEDHAIDFTVLSDKIVLGVKKLTAVSDLRNHNISRKKNIDKEFSIECSEEIVKINFPRYTERGFTPEKKALIKEAISLSLGSEYSYFSSLITDLGFGKNFFNSFKIFKSFTYNRKEDSFAFTLRRDLGCSFKLF